MNDPTPCMHCVPPKRHAFCHANCPDWDKHVKKEAVKKEKEKKRKQELGLYIDYMKSTYAKVERKKRGKK